MFIRNSRGAIISPLTDVDASRLDGCTILAKLSNSQARYIQFVSLGTLSKFGFNTTDDDMYYEFINNTTRLHSQIGE